MTSPQDGSAYLLDVESGSEMARLLDQDRFVTEAMGGVFSERTTLEGIFDALDIGCGPGGWVHSVAHQFPEIEVTGIDISESMINYARAHANVRGLTNAHFRVMNASRSFDYPDASFDLINIRSAIGYIPAAQWPTLLTECYRILRPSGIMRWTESEWGETNKPAIAALYEVMSQILFRSKLGFSITGHSMGIIHMMGHLLRDAGFQHTQHKAHALDASYGTKTHEGLYHDFVLLLQSIPAIAVKMSIITQQQADELIEQVPLEMQSADMLTMSIMLTTWGVKPAQ